MFKPKIFVSFDFEKDKHYKYTLNMWNANPNFEFTCNDKSPSEIQSWNIPTIKSVLSRKIKEATHVIVIVGKEVKGFIREGENYLENYPMVLNFIDLFYKMLMPVIFIGINGARIYREWIFLDKTIIALLCDTILFMAIFIITWFYFFEIHSKITEFF